MTSPESARSAARALLVALAVGLPSAQAAGQAGTVESWTKIATSDGPLAGELASGDAFGRAVSALGDLDGNGTGDLAVGAPGDDGGGSDAGAVWILFLAPDGSVERSQRIGNGSGGFGGTLEAGDGFGTSVAALDDLDGDGVRELAVGAPGDDDGGSILFPDPRTGATWILFLRRDGMVLAVTKLSNGNGGWTSELNELDRFGTSVARLPDTNGDGRDDLAVGAIGDNQNGPHAGAVWIAALAGDGTVLAHHKIALGGPLTQAGEALAPLGDLDGNGVCDLAASGLWFNGVKQKYIGFLLIVFLEAGGLEKETLETKAPLGAGDGFGSALAPLGDLDGDGVVDLAVGGPLGDLGGPDRGQVWVALLRPDGSSKAWTRIGAGSGGFGGALDDGDRFGGGLAALGDVDGDGTLDLASGAPGDDDGSPDSGGLWQLHLDDGRWTDLGLGLAGTNGIPVLEGKGVLAGGDFAALALEGALPGGPVTLFVGASFLGAPLLGGVLGPAADLVIPGLVVGADGTLELVGRWPPDAPLGLASYYQFWIEDPAGAEGWAASNVVATGAGTFLSLVR